MDRSIEQGGLLPPEQPPPTIMAAPADGACIKSRQSSIDRLIKSSTDRQLIYTSFQTTGVAPLRKEGEKEMAYMTRVNAELRRRLGEKDMEIASLRER